MSYRYNTDRSRRAQIARRWSWRHFRWYYVVLTYRSRVTDGATHWRRVWPICARTLEDAQARMQEWLDNNMIRMMGV